jgi:hypothetical protein
MRAVVETKTEIGGVREGDNVSVRDPASDTIPVGEQGIPPIEVAPNDIAEGNRAVT